MLTRAPAEDLDTTWGSLPTVYGSALDGYRCILSFNPAGDPTLGHYSISAIRPR